MQSARRIVAAALASLVLLAAGPPPARGDDALDETVRKLEKEITAVRGLSFKSPVVAKVVPRPRDAAKKVQGYYSIKDKALFVYDDVSGAYEKGVLIHEMVHALQDQNFGLDRLHDNDAADDAALAKAALIEGDATFTMIEVLKKEQPKVTAMLDAPLVPAKDLHNAFLYAQGARYVKALKDRGGWDAVNNAYRFPPDATADVLHPDGISTMDLGPGKTVGELGIIGLLSAKEETAPQALEIAAGWRGDRTIEEGASKAWVVALASDEAAARFQKAVGEFAEGDRLFLLRGVDGHRRRTGRWWTAWTGRRR
jgi:hypothetical protein